MLFRRSRVRRGATFAGDTDAQSPVGQRHRTTEHHDIGADPDQGHERVIVNAHGIAAIACRVAEHNIEIPTDEGLYSGFSGGLAAHGIEALGRFKPGDDFAIVPHCKACDVLGVIGSLTRGNALECNIIAGNGQSFTRGHCSDDFGFPGGDPDNT